MSVTPAEPVAPAAPVDPAPVVPAAPADPPVDKTDWKAEARKHEQRAKDNKAAADELAALKAANATDAEKAAARAEAAEKRATTLLDRTVRAEVKALAADRFIDPSDAEPRDTAKYVNADGDVDTAAIESDLAALLAAKPHLAKPTGPRVPAPNPAQGSGGNGTVPDFDTEIAAATKAGNHLKAIALKQARSAASRVKT